MTQQETKHTSGTWTIEPRESTNCIRIKSHNSNMGYRDYIVQIADVFGTNGEDLVNAKYIVKCVNSHTKLVEALKTMQKTAEVGFEDILKSGHLSSNHAREYRRAKQNAIEILAEIDKDGE